MKKKILFGLGVMALVAVLSLNVNLAKTNNDGNFSLKDLFSTAQADGEFDPIAECNAWCWTFPDCCTLMTNYGFEIDCWGWIMPS